MDAVKFTLWWILKDKGAPVIFSQLVYDYENQTGEEFPHREFGFRTPFKLLASMTDILTVKGVRISLNHRPDLRSAGPDVECVTVTNTVTTGGKRSTPAVPVHIQELVGQLASKHPNGIHVQDFLHLFEKIVKVRFDYKKHEFSSGFSLLESCSTVTVALDHVGEFVVYPSMSSPIRRAPTIDIHSSMDACSSPPIQPKMPLATLFDIEKLIPHGWKDWYDENECDVLFKYTNPKVPNEEWISLEIVDAFSPADFWVHTWESKAKFHKLMNDLNDYYNKLSAPDNCWDSNLTHKLPPFYVGPGLAVCAYYQEDWVRAEIISIDDNKLEMEIFCVDYGTIDTVKRSNVRTLHRMFGDVEKLAIKASMSNVRPPTDEWSMNSYEYMYGEWSYITLRGKVVKVDPEEPRLEMYLFSDKAAKFKNNFTYFTEDVYNLNEMLVLSKYAEWIVVPGEKELLRDLKHAEYLQVFEPPEELEDRNPNTEESPTSSSHDDHCPCEPIKVRPSLEATHLNQTPLSTQLNGLSLKSPSTPPQGLEAEVVVQYIPFNFEFPKPKMNDARADDDEEGVVHPLIGVHSSIDACSRPPGQPKMPPAALPDLEKLIPHGWKDWYDENECDVLFKYTNPKVPNEEWISLEIVDAYSPTDFWVHTWESKAKLDKLMIELNDYYNKLPAPDNCCDSNLTHKLPPFDVEPGLAVCIYYAGDWLRAEIKSIDDNKCEIEAFCVDYGTIATVKRSNVSKLHRMFGDVEKLAIKASMSNVRPPSGEWSMDSYEYMYHEWALTALRGKIVKVDPEEPRLEMFLFSDKSSKCIDKDVYNLNEILVKEKYAEWIVVPGEKELLRDLNLAKFLQDSEPLEEQEYRNPNEPPEEQEYRNPNCTENYKNPNIDESSKSTFLLPKPKMNDAVTDLMSTQSSKRFQPKSSLEITKTEQQESKMGKCKLTLKHRVFQAVTISHATINFSTKKSTTQLHLILNDGQYLVSKKTLFKLVQIPGLLASYHYEYANLGSNELNVNKLTHPELWELLHELKLVGDADIHHALVPLRDAASICKTIDPSGSYDDLMLLVEGIVP